MHTAGTSESGPAAAAASDFSFAALELLDGERWTLAEGGVGRPFSTRLLLVNRGPTSIRVWQPGTTEGDACIALLLSDADGRETVLRPAPTLRITGEPQITTVEPGRLLRIDLDLLRLVRFRSPAPGSYRLQGVYENVLPRSMGVDGLWTGRIASESHGITITPP